LLFSWKVAQGSGAVALGRTSERRFAMITLQELRPARQVITIRLEIELGSTPTANVSVSTECCKTRGGAEVRTEVVPAMRIEPAVPSVTRSLTRPVSRPSLPVTRLFDGARRLGGVARRTSMALHGFVLRALRSLPQRSLRIACRFPSAFVQLGRFLW
jgi:hypothetical protein